MKTLALVLSVTVFLTGCQRRQQAAPDRVSDIPLIVDEAMQKRDWEPSTLYYPNGATVGGATGYMFETNSRIPAGAHRGTDPFVAAGNIFILPVTFPLSKPWQAREYPGVQIPPTYTAQPPLD